jgi:site-specific DNA-methyltransferase (adenine-specific)/site-specific DNA-methyltransferase (cytosine-N4-specific)
MSLKDSSTPLGVDYACRHCGHRFQAQPRKQHRIMCGDSRASGDMAKLMEEEKAQGVVTSPPYAEQRQQQYGGVPADAYVAWWEALQANVREHLLPDGSFFVNIKPHCEDGERVLYVMDLVLAMKRRWGWRFVDEFCWRHAGYPGGWPNRFKNGFEPVYHFSLAEEIKFRPEALLMESPYAEQNAKRIRARRPTDRKFHKGWRCRTGSGFGDMHGFTEEQARRVRPDNVVEVHVSQLREGHPASFPVGLVGFFLKAFSDPGDLWLDPFLGSGSVTIAAQQLGRCSAGMELLPAYVEVAILRWQKMTGRDAILEATGQTFESAIGTSEREARHERSD